jgi:hypothetical protein
MPYVRIKTEILDSIASYCPRIADAATGHTIPCGSSYQIPFEIR